jgi:DNA-directed RNA polymerase subunit RPC12/RpoP
MTPGNASTTAAQSGRRPEARTESSDSYKCVLCGTSWGYSDIHNTARCPSCGGGLVRDRADNVRR